MNLVELRQMVGSIVDYDPDVQTYREEVERIINELYLDFYTDRPWKFAQKTVEQQIYMDVSDAAGGISLGTSTVTSGSNIFLDWMEGHIVEISGSTSDDGEYTIQKFVGVGSVIVGGFSGSVAETVTITVKQRYIDMPADCSEVLSIGLRDPTQSPTTQFDYLSRADDEMLSLLLSSTGLPTNWLLHDDTRVTAPVTTPTLEEDAGATFTEVGTYYALVAFVHRNKISAISQATSLDVTTTGGFNLNAIGLQGTGANSGIFKRLYLRTPSSKAFYKVSNNDVAETPLLLNTLALQADYLSSGQRVLGNGGLYKRVRLYPRQDTNYKVQIRYVARPTRLIEETDVPRFPTDHHRYLGYRACQELFVKHDNTSNSDLYRRKADTEMLRLENNYLSEGAGYWVKKGFQRRRAIYRTATSLTTSN